MSPIRTAVRLRSTRSARSRPLPPLPAAVLAGCLALGSAAACAGGAGPGTPGPAAGEEAGQARDGRPPGPGGAYARRVAPFPVLDSAGRPYDHPFLGGLNVPRPQLVDIDGDGDADLFLQELTGQVAFFERTDSAGGAYAWRTDAWRDLPVGEWYRFADMDGDGDFDLLAEEPYSYIRLYRNVGSAEEPRFELAADSLKDVSGEPIFSDRQNIPNVADIDCDGRLDLLIGRLTGTITHYEEAGSREGLDGRPVPTFEKVTDRFEGIEIIGQMQMAPGGNVPGANVPGAGAPPGPPPPEGAEEPPPGGPPPGPAALLPSREAGVAGGRPTMHGANTLILVDVDGDGDQDLLWGDFFEPGLLLIENTGGCENPDLRSTPRPWPVQDPLATSGYNAPAFGDVDGDGEPDVLVGVLGGAFNPIRTSAANLYRLAGEGEGWELTTRRFLSQVDVGTESVPAFGDLDGDGDLDLLVGNKIEPDEPATSRIRYYENVAAAGAPELRLRGSLPIEGTYHYAPALGDLDGNGRPDLVLGTWRDRVELYLNRGPTEGKGGAPRLELADSALVRITRGSNTTPALGDLDGDGDLDLLVGESSGALNLYRNVGDAREPRFELVSDEFGGIDVGRRSVPSLVDLDGDGDLDLVVGSEGGELAWFRNDGTPEEPRFVRAGALPVPAQGYAAPAFVDLDGDGDLDVVVGTAGGGLLYFEREGG